MEFKPCNFDRLTGEEARAFLISLGENPDLPKRGVSRHQHPVPVAHMRNHVCEVDGHQDPDNSGLCIYCSCVYDPDDLDTGNHAYNALLVVDKSRKVYEKHTLGESLTTKRDAT